MSVNMMAASLRCSAFSKGTAQLHHSCQEDQRILSFVTAMGANGRPDDRLQAEQCKDFGCDFFAFYCHLAEATSAIVSLGLVQSGAANNDLRAVFGRLS